MGLGTIGVDSVTDVQAKPDKGRHPFPVAKIGVMAKQVVAEQEKIANEERLKHEQFKVEALARVRSEILRKNVTIAENQLLREKYGSTRRRQAEVRRAIGLPPTVSGNGEQAVAGGKEKEGKEVAYHLKRAEYQGTGQLPIIENVPWQGVPGRRMIELKTEREPRQGDVIEVETIDKGQVDRSTFEVVQKPINAEAGRSDELFVQWIGPKEVQVKVDSGKEFHKFEIGLPPGASLDATKARSTLPGWVKQ